MNPIVALREMSDRIEELEDENARLRDILKQISKEHNFNDSLISDKLVTEVFQALRGSEE